MEEHHTNEQEVPVEDTPKASGTTFASMGLSPRIVDILHAKEITVPTPIQEQSIMPGMNGSDVIGIAQTGTGKTLAFSLPLVHQLLEKRGKVLVMAPTRELAFQIQETFDWFKRALKIYSTVIVGGASMKRQLEELRRKPQVIIATPGRLIDHLDQGTINLSDVNHLVLDEADRMFDMGFAPQIKEVLKHIPPAAKRQTLLFSATMPDAIADLITKHMKEPVRIEVARQGTAAKNVQQEIVVIDNAHRKQALLELLEQNAGAAIIFSRTKFGAKKLTRFLRDQGYGAEELHSNRTLPQRKKAVAAVQSGRSTILVATDIAARGIDLNSITLVVNFELPDNAEDYVHRIGRTGRAGKKGRAVSFVLSDQSSQLRQIQKLINNDIDQTHLNTVPSAKLDPNARPPKKRYGGNRGGSNSRGRSRGRRSGGYGGGGRRRGSGNNRGRRHA